MDIDERELEEFMSTLSRDILASGKWDYTGEAGLVIVPVSMDPFDCEEVMNFCMESAIEGGPLVKTFDIDSLAEALGVAYDDESLKKISCFILGEWLANEFNVIVSVDVGEAYEPAGEDIIDALKIAAAQYKVSAAVLEGK